MPQSVGEQVVQYPAELEGVQLAEDGTFWDGDLQREPRQIDLLVLHGQIFPQKFAQVSALRVEDELRMLHLAVLMKGVDQLGESLRLALDGPQVAGLLLGRNLAVADGVDVAGNDSDGGFQVVGDIGNQFLTSLVQNPALALTLRQPVGETVKALSNAADFQSTSALANPYKAALRLGDHRVVELAQRTADLPTQPPDEQSCIGQEQRQEQKPNDSGLVVVSEIISLIPESLPQKQGHSLTLAVFKGSALKKTVRISGTGKQLIFPGGIAGFPVLQSAQEDLIILIQRHQVHRFFTCITLKGVFDK